MAYKRISPQPINEGGTNTTSLTTTDGVVYFDGTGLNTTAVGTSGDVLTSNGTGMAPTFQPAGGGGFNCAFSYYLNNTISNATGDGTTYTLGTDALTQQFDLGNNCTTGGLFTAPATGVYVFSGFCTFTGISIANTGIATSLYITSTPNTYDFYSINPSSTNYAVSSSLVTSIINLNVGDTVTASATVSGTSKTVTIFGAGVFPYSVYFAGYQIA